MTRKANWSNQTTFYATNYQCWPPVSNTQYFDGNSSHWEAQARRSFEQLYQALGDEQYDRWAEETYPGNAIDSLSWYSIYKINHAALTTLTG